MIFRLIKLKQFNFLLIIAIFLSYNCNNKNILQTKKQENLIPKNANNKHISNRYNKNHISLLIKKKSKCCILSIIMILLAQYFIMDEFFPVIDFCENNLDLPYIHIDQEKINNNYLKYEEDWFDKNKWDLYQKKNLTAKNYQIIENICTYNQEYKVFNKSDIFKLNNFDKRNFFGIEGKYKEIDFNTNYYKKHLKANIWDTDEYENANCKIDKITNHFVILSRLPQMLGEFYVRIILPLYHLRDLGLITSDDIKIWLIYWDQKLLLTSHHLFLEPFTRFSVQHINDMIVNHMSCICYKRILFLGFKKYDMNIWKPESNILFFRETNRTKYINRKAINFINNHFYDIDKNLEKDIFLFKKEQIEKHLNYSIKNDEVKNWNFIGLYDRKGRRKWININKICKIINTYKNCLCYIIILETDIGHNYPRDLIIIHKSMNLLIGIHGAQLTDAIFLNGNKQASVIELLMEYANPWTNKMHKPTPLGVIFQNSKIFHVGLLLKLRNQFFKNKRINTSTDKLSIWAKSDFIVEWKNELKYVFEYLMLEGGPCITDNTRKSGIQNTFNKNLPNKIKRKLPYRFTIYNSYCSPLNNTSM